MDITVEERGVAVESLVNLDFGTGKVKRRCCGGLWKRRPSHCMIASGSQTALTAGCGLHIEINHCHSSQLFLGQMKCFPYHSVTLYWTIKE
ncbi:MAG: hypothetical protein ACRD4Q_01935 [Candidatus Acidiferrales bacterium]